MKKLIIYSLSLFFIILGAFLISPLNPYSFLSDFLSFIKGFIPVFLFFTGTILFLFNIVDIKQINKDKKNSD